MDEDAVLEELAQTAMGGMSTHGVQATKERMEREALGITDEPDFEEEAPPPVEEEKYPHWSPEPIKITKKHT